MFMSSPELLAAWFPATDGFYFLMVNQNSAEERIRLQAQPGVI